MSDRRRLAADVIRKHQGANKATTQFVDLLRKGGMDLLWFRASKKSIREELRSSYFSYLKPKEKALLTAKLKTVRSREYPEIMANPVLKAAYQDAKRAKEELADALKCAIDNMEKQFERAEKKQRLAIEASQMRDGKPLAMEVSHGDISGGDDDDDDDDDNDSHEGSDVGVGPLAASVRSTDSEDFDGEAEIVAKSVEHATQVKQRLALRKERGERYVEELRYTV